MNFNSQANSYEINYSMQRERNGDDQDHRNDHNDGRNDHNMVRDDHAMHGRYHEDHPQSFGAYSDKDIESMHSPNVYHPSLISANHSNSNIPPQIAPLNYHHPSSHSPFSPHSIAQNSPLNYHHPSSHSPFSPHSIA